ncbi:hypothetical protein ZWY2020_012370 [Hordeum vulgare]|nr:hypothetical protein ZWY2020_012370 [Hordeum vulgare]
MQGWRTTMEDAVSLPFPPPSPPPALSVFCVAFASTRAAPARSVYIVYTMIGDVCLYIVGKDEYDELALSEVIFAITSAVKDVCAKPPTERLFLDKYGRICLCLDEIVWQAVSELGAGAKSLLLSLEPHSSSDASGEYFFSDYGLGEPLASFPMHVISPTAIELWRSSEKAARALQVPSPVIDGRRPTATWRRSARRSALPPRRRFGLERRQNGGAVRGGRGSHGNCDSFPLPGTGDGHTPGRPILGVG